LEDVESLAAQAKSVGALTILCSNPLAYGIFKSAAEAGADIAVGDCQPFGIPLQYGGPYLGYIACRQELVRQLPGRLVGQTTDTQGRRGFVLTLQAREQHIRREKATSNICTNQALAALASLTAILWYGPQGIRELALANYQRAAYLRKELGGLKGIEILGKGVHFNEFAIRIQKPLEIFIEHFKKQKIQPGVPLGHFYPEMEQCLLIAVTETKSLEQLDRYVQTAKEALQ
jgi:glycine dehydrogenase subunit 1